MNVIAYPHDLNAISATYALLHWSRTSFRFGVEPRVEPLYASLATYTYKPILNPMATPSLCPNSCATRKNAAWAPVLSDTPRRLSTVKALKLGLLSQPMPHSCLHVRT